MQIIFPSQGQYDLARAIVAHGPAPVPDSAPGALSLHVSDPNLALLLQRLADGVATVLPLFDSSCDRWLVAAAVHHTAERALAHISRFLLPSYGALPGNAQFAGYRAFADTNSPLPAAASAVGYNGYFELRTPSAQRMTVLRRLGLWAKLEAVAPSLAQKRSPLYVDLFAEYQSAVAAANWAGAEKVLADMQHLHLCTFDNLQFLRIELLAHRGDWHAIWSDGAFSAVAARPAPRAVRAAMLAAFHQSELLLAEQAGDYNAVLASLHAVRPRLGMLLTGRFDIAHSAVIRVFAYQAAATHDRDALEDLLARTPLDESAQTVLTALRDRFPRPPQLTLSPTERLYQALRQRNYDAAVRAAGEIDDRIERVLALVRIAFRHADAASTAIAAYDILTPEEREQLEDEEPLTDIYLNRLLNLAPQPQAPIRAWPDWFDQLAINPNDAGLEDAVDLLRKEMDDRSWSPDILRATRQRLETIFFENDALLTSHRVQRALTAITDQLLGDTQFPYDDDAYTGLYDMLLDCLVLRHEANETEGRKLLRLMDARLRRQPDHVTTSASDLRGWFAHPSLALESLVLDGFDLLINYGAQRQTIFDLYRKWLDHLLDLPSTVAWERTSQEVWLSIGEWLQPGDDLLRPLRQRLTVIVAAEVQDPLTRLPTGYKIAIFTLNPSAANRAAQIIQRRNPHVHLQINSDTVLTAAASTLASRADIAVIVSSCLTHALFYGIKPYLQRDPVYPSFQGAASIMRELEKFAERL
jgi:hypothetical protein